MVFVLRSFVDPDIPGPTDPLEHLRVLEIELTLADLESVESRLVKRRKSAVQDPVAGLARWPLWRRRAEVLDEGTPLYRSDLAVEQRDDLRESFLLTNRPVLAVVNIGEDQLDNADSVIEPVSAELDGRAGVMAVCVQLEAEAAQLPAEERG